MKHFQIVLLILFTITLQAQTFEGFIGKHSIFLELDADFKDNRALGFYFYKSQLKQIDLKGEFISNQLILHDKFPTKAEDQEDFTLVLMDNKISGIWTKNGKELEVNLTKVDDNLEQFKLKHLEFKRDSVSTYNAKELVWLTEKHSGKSLFRLGNGFTKEEREFVNPRLDAIQKQFAIIGLDCSWADFEIEIELISDRFISISEFSSIYCGGAHPNHNNAGYNFDLKNLKQLIKITDLYPGLNYYELLKTKYDNDSEQQIECDYFTYGKEIWDYCSWIITEKGISITPTYPHVLAPCETGFLLTFEELGQK